MTTAPPPDVLKISNRGLSLNLLSAATRIDLVYFKLFDNCNAKCNMCDCWERPRARLGLDHYMRVLANVLTAAPSSIRFTGGEPLLFKGLPQLVSKAAATGARTSVISNGRLLATNANRLAESGCAEVVVSLDGVATSHDLIRNTARLFELTLRGIDEVCRTGMTYGVNTVVQRHGIRDLPRLAGTLLDRAKRPSWWHLIPVRDHAALIPTPAEASMFREQWPALVAQMEAAGVRVIAEADMFVVGTAVPCTVPQFAAYVDAETGSVYGCNMLAYADQPLGSVAVQPLSNVLGGQAADDLKARCASARNAVCSRCDGASRRMNHHLRQLASGPN